MFWIAVGEKGALRNWKCIISDSQKKKPKSKKQNRHKETNLTSNQCVLGRPWASNEHCNTNWHFDFSLWDLSRAPCWTVTRLMMHQYWDNNECCFKLLSLVLVTVTGNQNTWIVQDKKTTDQCLSWTLF